MARQARHFSHKEGYGGSNPLAATMIIYKKGDVLNSNEEVVVHGCNCFKTMGSGIARQVRAECPNAYAADQKTLYGDKTKLGTFTWGKEANGMIVINAYTQYGYTRTNVDLDYEALTDVMTFICEWMDKEMLGKVLAMPKIGCGLAGGDWNIVSGILEDISNEYDMIFYVYELET